MAKLLYVTCDLKPVEHSRSLIVGSEFLNEYLKCNPEDEIHMLDLFRDNIQRTDADVLSGLEKMRYGHHFAALSSDEQRKISRVWKFTDQFIAVDKYVLVTPMWNMGFPAEIKMYIDTVCVVNKTYRDTRRGPEGLLKDQGRKCLLIHSTDGLGSRKKEAYCVSYIRSVMKFMGIEDFEAISITGAEAIHEKTVERLEKEIEKAVKLAVEF
ncbi:MAG: NAD(P)H-dependent oxidoreductase [Desulfuromonadales bacterium]|nr:NAD(P)H-dependent oxidoreductase [Desulfuromonadales bacterium]